MRWLHLAFPPTPGAPRVAWRDLAGGDEEAVADDSPRSAIALIDRLLVAAPGAAVAPGQAATLAVSDRDRLMAEIHAAEFGPRIDCVARCGGCGASYDIDFRLPDLVASLYAAAREDVPALRPPTGEDELAVEGLPADEASARMLARCRVGGLDDEALSQALDAQAPLIDVDLDAVCPECGAETQAHFDLQRYLLTSILQEAPARIGEIHLLASTYGWSLSEILSLSRRRRRAFAQIIDRDRAYAGSA